MRSSEHATLTVSTSGRLRFFTLGILLLAVLLSSMSFQGYGATLPSTPSSQSTLAFTVEPDRSVSVGLNTTTTLPKNSTMGVVFPPGYTIHSTSSFSQQSNAVVQTSTTSYVVPSVVNQQTGGILGQIKSMTLTATQTGSSGQGSLQLTAISPSVILPVDNVVVNFSYNTTHVHVDASAQVYFFPQLSGTPLANQTAFTTTWDKTLGNTTLVTSQIQNLTRILKVTNYTPLITSISSLSASVSIVLDAIPNATATDFISAFEQVLASSGGTIPSSIDSMIRSALALITSETLTLTYTGSTNTLIVQSTTNYVPDLDSRLNALKTQFFQYLLGNLPAGTPIPPAVSFVDSTAIYVSKMSMTSDLDLNASIERTTLQGLVLKPPTVGSNTNFTIPGLFQTIGMIPHSVQNITSITLVGGSNATYSMKIIVPPGTPQPSSTTANSDTWANQNASELQNVRFELQLVASGGLLALLTSPMALIIEAVAAVAIVAALVFLLRRRRGAVTTPAPSPTMGPSPTPQPPTPTPSPATP